MEGSGGEVGLRILMEIHVYAAFLRSLSVQYDMYGLKAVQIHGWHFRAANEPV